MRKYESIGVTARDIMRKHVVAANPEMTLREVADLFIRNKISGVPVVGDDNELVGVVSHKDLVRYDSEAVSETELPSYYFDQDHPLPRNFEIELPDHMRVKDIMTPHVITASETDDVMDIARRMFNKKIHHIIITCNGKLRGIVTTQDLLGAFLRYMETMPEKLLANI